MVYVNDADSGVCYMDEVMFDLRDMVIEDVVSNCTKIATFPGDQKVIKVLRNPYAAHCQLLGMRHKP